MVFPFKIWLKNSSFYVKIPKSRCHMMLLSRDGPRSHVTEHRAGSRRGHTRVHRSHWAPPGRTKEGLRLWGRGLGGSNFFGAESCLSGNYLGPKISKGWVQTVTTKKTIDANTPNWVYFENKTNCNFYLSALVHNDSNNFFFGEIDIWCFIQLIGFVLLQQKKCPV